jgi:hypothetical protein
VPVALALWWLRCDATLMCLLCKSMPVGVRDAANQVAIGAGVGGIEYVLAAMRRYPDGAGVQESGCGALGNLAFTNAANLAAIAAAGGIDVVVAAMRRHADAAGVQEHGCAALWNLAVSAANKAVIIRTGGRDVVTAARRRHGSKAADGALRVLQ